MDGYHQNRGRCSVLKLCNGIFFLLMPRSVSKSLSTIKERKSRSSCLDQIPLVEEAWEGPYQQNRTCLADLASDQSNVPCRQNRIWQHNDTPNARIVSGARSWSEPPLWYQVLYPSTILKINIACNIFTQPLKPISTHEGDEGSDGGYGDDGEETEGGGG
jgi:hypothetical protein